MKKQNKNELEFARLFEVEELEERMEFGAWIVSFPEGPPPSVTPPITINY